MERGPIYIAGLERSGTSLIYALLASHPNIAMFRRTYMWTYFYDRYGDLAQPENFERCLAAMMRYKRLLVLKPDPERIRREFRQGEPTYARLFALLGEHYAERAGKPRWGDKSLNTERYADPIFAAYPSARILHMIRDPRDRYASALARWKISRGGAGAATAMWLWSVGMAQRNQVRHPDRYQVIRYETLAARPEETLRQICAFIGEEYDPAMLTLEGAETFRDKGGNSSYGSRAQGVISTSSIGRFRKVLAKHEIAFMQTYAGAEMLAYGYDPDPVRLRPGERAFYAVGSWPLNMARMIAWRARESIQNRVGRNLPSYRIVADPASRPLDPTGSTR
jgi:hypothetical protein